MAKTLGIRAPNSPLFQRIEDYPVDPNTGLPVITSKDMAKMGPAYRATENIPVPERIGTTVENGAVDPSDLYPAQQPSVHNLSLSNPSSVASADGTNISSNLPGSNVGVQNPGLIQGSHAQNLVTAYAANQMADQAQPGQTIQPSPAQTSGTTGTMSAEAKAGITAGANVLGQLAQTQANYAANEYNQDYSNWQLEGKYWFDPNANLKPDLDAYMQKMPSMTSAMDKTGWGSEKNNAWIGGFINPLGGATTGIANLTGNKEFAKKSAYSVQKGNEGALKGLASGGWVGAIVGGVVGVVEGLLGYSKAEEQDKKNAQKARDEYLQAMKEWTFNNNVRITQRSKAQQKFLHDWDIADKEKRTQMKLSAAAQQRANLMNTLNQAAQNKQYNTSKIEKALAG